MPLITASTSLLSRRYGAVETSVLRPLVMVIRPRDLAPRPRYCDIVMASARVKNY